MRPLPRLAGIAACTLLLMACSKPEQKAPPENSSASEAFTFEVWAEGAPRPITSATMTAYYQVMDSSCLPSKPISGASAVSWNHLISAEVKPLGDGRFATTLFNDRFLDTDLYGLGVCDWELVFVETILNDGTVRIRHTGSATTEWNEPEQIADFHAYSPSDFDVASNDRNSGVSTPQIESVQSGLLVLGPVGPAKPDADFDVRYPAAEFVRVVSTSHAANLAVPR